jgi:hypothetical protein
MARDPSDIDLVSIEAVPEGMKVLGLVRGSTARSRNIGRDITAALKNLVGGEVTSYTKLMADAREEAIYRMQTDALGPRRYNGDRCSFCVVTNYTRRLGDGGLGNSCRAERGEIGPCG